VRRGADARGFLGDVLLGLSGLLVWAGHFLLVYVATALLCARTSAGAFIPFFILLATVLAVAALAAVAVLARRRLRHESSGRRLLARLAIFGAAIALVAVIWQAMPAGFLPSC
jgi:hypothetical protein